MEYTVALVQGLYFLITGVWPLVSMRTFLMVTGPKTDLWLVKTMGVILAVIGLVLLYAWAAGAVNPPVIALAIGAGLGLAIVEMIYVSNKVISAIYLGDAVVEILLAVWWALALLVA
jgi:hypothetical protein